MSSRSKVVSAIALAGALLASGALAQSYPDKPVRVVVGLAPGGGTDVSARFLSQKLADALGQPFVVDNRPGAGSNLATELVVRAAPDGYTLLFASPTFVVNPSLWRKVAYDPIRDFAPVVLVVSGQYVLSVRSSVAANSVKELIALAKAEPRRLSYASTGVGSANHLAGELFKTMAGVDMVHVPYKGAAPAANALITGEVQVIFTSISGIMPHAKAGRVKVLAVTGLKRTAIAPEIPTIAESGLPGFDVTGWYGMLAPARTPKAIVDRLNAAANQALPGLRERFAQLGTDVVGGTPAEFAAFLKSEVQKWAAVVKLSGARVE